MIGIIINNNSSNSNIISENIIHSLEHTSDGRPSVCEVVGIYFSGGQNNKIDKNFIHSLNLNNSNNNPELYIRGMVFVFGHSIVSNNMIRLGIDKYGNNIDKNYTIQGIYSEGITNLNFVHNTICITGTVLADGENNTSAIVRNGAFLIYTFNNIIFNSRSNVRGTGSHYCLFTNFEQNIMSNYNLFFASGRGGVVGSINSGVINYLDLSSWQTATGLDNNSLYGYPNFINHLGNHANVDLHVKSPTPIESQGTVFVTETYDFDNQIRINLTPVDIGADAGNFEFGFPIGIENTYTTEIPNEFYLSQNFPNPVSLSSGKTNIGTALTKINFGVIEDDFYSIKIYNSLGQEVKEILSEHLNKGTYTIDFNASALSSGVYFYRLSSRKVSLIKKMLIVR